MILVLLCSECDGQSYVVDNTLVSGSLFEYKAQAWRMIDKTMNMPNIVTLLCHYSLHSLSFKLPNALVR